MYFTTFNHDDDTIYNDNDTIYNDEVCLICWEPSTTNKNIDKMKSFLYASSFYTSCTCNGKFHHDCLLKWTNMSQSCPICRIKIDTYDDKKLQLPLTFNIFNIFNILIFLFKCLFLFCFIKTLFDIEYSVEKYTDERQCQSMLL